MILPGETEAGNEVTVGAEDVVLAVRDTAEAFQKTSRRTLPERC
jgi:hypothetical protein